MWTKWELDELEGTLRDITLEDVLTEEEINVIKENSSRYENLKSSIMIPKHTKPVKTIIMKQIDGGLYMDLWVRMVSRKIN